MALNTTEIILIPVLVFVVIIFAIVVLAHVNRFIMEHRRYFPRCCIRQSRLAQRWKRHLNKILLTVHVDFSDNFGFASVFRVIIRGFTKIPHPMEDPLWSILLKAIWWWYDDAKEYLIVQHESWDIANTWVLRTA